AFSALVLAATFVLLPWKLFGSAYADTRLAPYVFAVALLAIREKGPGLGRLGGTVAATALFFWTAKVALTTVSLQIASREQDEYFKALDHVPRGVALAT